MIVIRTTSKHVLLLRRNDDKNLELRTAEPLSDGSFWHRDLLVLDHDQTLHLANELFNLAAHMHEQPIHAGSRTLAEMIELHPRAKQLLIDAGIISTDAL
jgi:hypothetical protein